MRIHEKLTYTNERGESVEFSPASLYHVNFKDVKGLSDVRNAIYSTNSMGQDGDTYLGYRIEARDIDIVGHIKERDKQAAQTLRRNMNRILWTSKEQSTMFPRTLRAGSRAKRAKQKSRRRTTENTLTTLSRKRAADQTYMAGLTRRTSTERPARPQQRRSQREAASA